MSTNKELEDQLAALRKDVEVLASLAGQRAQDIARDKMDSARDQMESLSSEARAAYDRAADEGRRLRENTEDQIRSNPLAATGLAFLAGAVLASLLGRR